MDIAEKLAEAHWSYIKELLLTHGEHIDNVEKIGFHYKSAMIHGYKHGVADAWCPNFIEEEK